MPYPTYMDQLGAWPSSPDPITSWRPSAPPTAQPPSVTGTTDPNAELSSQAIMDMVRRKQEAYGQEPWSGVGSPLTGQTPDLRSLYQTPDGAQGVATRNPDITNQISATSDAAGMMQSPTNADNRATQLPSDQRTLIGGSPALTRGLPPEVYNNILKQTAGDPRYDSAQITGRNETTGQDFTAQPGRRIPLSVAQSIAAKQQLEQALAQGNQQADLANQRGIARARVPGQNAVDLENARGANAQALQAPLLAAQDKLNAQGGPMRAIQQRQAASQADLMDAQVQAEKTKLAQQTPEMQALAGLQDYVNKTPTMADEDRQAIEGYIASKRGGGSLPANIQGIVSKAGQATPTDINWNTQQYINGPEFQSMVQQVKSQRPTHGSEIGGALGFKTNNMQKFTTAYQSKLAYLNALAAHNHLDPKILHDELRSQIMQ